MESDLGSLQITSLEEDEEEDDEMDDFGKGEQEDDEDDEEDEEEVDVTLGFVDKPKNHCLLLRHLFPSKAGGIPAWLDPVNLPSEKSFTCGFCRDPLQFLLQIYAPISDKESTFHRILYVFMCPSMSCLLRDQHEQWKLSEVNPYRSVKIFRCQLPRSNPFYLSVPPKRNDTDKPTITGAPLCYWCGAWKGDKVCSSCKHARYCSAKHQSMHWRLGHKIECCKILNSSDATASCIVNGKAKVRATKNYASNSLWPEYEIIIEEECTFDSEIPEDNRSITSLAFTSNSVDETYQLLSDKFEAYTDKKVWASFQERVAKAPEQVLRITQILHVLDETHSIASCIVNGKAKVQATKNYASNSLWPEYEIIIEEERTFDSEIPEDNRSITSLAFTSNSADETYQLLSDKFEADTDKKVWASFQERVAKAPEQVLRYCRDLVAKPLWPLSIGLPSKADIPRCNYCKGPLCYEFQIMPQLLFYFGVKNDPDSLDWGTIVVYTCLTSCDASIIYKEEFAWVQLYPTSTAVT